MANKDNQNEKSDVVKEVESLINNTDNNTVTTNDVDSMSSLVQYISDDDIEILFNLVGKTIEYTSSLKETDNIKKIFSTSLIISLIFNYEHGAFKKVIEEYRKLNRHIKE